MCEMREGGKGEEEWDEVTKPLCEEEPTRKGDERKGDRRKKMYKKKGRGIIPEQEYSLSAVCECECVYTQTVREGRLMSPQ